MVLAAALLKAANAVVTAILESNRRRAEREIARVLDRSGRPRPDGPNHP